MRWPVVFAARLVKNEIVIGIIGNTHGVSSDSSPSPNATPTMPNGPRSASFSDSDCGFAGGFGVGGAVVVPVPFASGVAVGSGVGSGVAVGSGVGVAVGTGTA